MFKGEKCHREPCAGRRKGRNFEQGGGGRSHRTDACEQRLEGSEVGSMQMCGGRRTLGTGSSRQKGFEEGVCWVDLDNRKEISLAGPLPRMKWGVGGGGRSRGRGQPSRACGPVKDLTLTLSFLNAVA